MADISLCKGTNCPRKESCLRFTQPPKDKWQAWMIMSVSIPDPNVCRFFISNENNLDTTHQGC